MDKFYIMKQQKKISSINRTVQFKPEVFEKLMEISEKSNLSFNQIVIQCLDFALTHYEEKRYE